MTFTKQLATPPLPLALPTCLPQLRTQTSAPVSFKAENKPLSSFLLPQPLRVLRLLLRELAACALEHTIPCRPASAPLSRNKETPNFSLRLTLAPCRLATPPSGPSPPMATLGLAPTDPLPGLRATTSAGTAPRPLSLTAPPGSSLTLAHQFPTDPRGHLALQPGPSICKRPCPEQPPGFNSRLDAGGNEGGIQVQPLARPPSLRPSNLAGHI